MASKTSGPSSVWGNPCAETAQQPSSVGAHHADKPFLGFGFYIVEELLARLEISHVEVYADAPYVTGGGGGLAADRAGDEGRNAGCLDDMYFHRTEVRALRMEVEADSRPDSARTAICQHMRCTRVARDECSICGRSFCFAHLVGVNVYPGVVCFDCDNDEQRINPCRLGGARTLIMSGSHVMVGALAKGRTSHWRHVPPLAPRGHGAAS